MTEKHKAPGWLFLVCLCATILFTLIRKIVMMAGWNAFFRGIWECFGWEFEIIVPSFILWIILRSIIIGCKKFKGGKDVGI